MKKYSAILLILFVGNAFAALNKWVDEKGHVFYSDRTPPANTKKSTLHFRAPPIVSAVTPTTPPPLPSTAASAPPPTEPESKK
jgi:hypothetical protein